jgi:nanoRNase/pAp phosphatase (c-di-AMP/oligoRNAs hydrolase)
MKWYHSFLMLPLYQATAAAQEPADYPQLVAQIHAQFGAAAEAKDIEKGWIFIRLYIPPVDTVKYTLRDRERWAHDVARFARTHSSVGGHAQAIAVQLVMVIQTAPALRWRPVGDWNWDVGQLDADSARLPDLLKGARPVRVTPSQ